MNTTDDLRAFILFLVVLALIFLFSHPGIVEQAVMWILVAR